SLSIFMISKKAFTLIELMVGMTLIALVIGMSYIPYAYQGKKIRLTQAGKEISQSLYEARNMALAGTASGSNLSIGVYLDNDEANKNSLSFYGYPHDQVISDPTGGELLESRLLPEGVEIRNIGGYNNGLFLFSAVYGSGTYITFDTFGNTNTLTGSQIQVEYAYKNADSTSPLFTDLEYLPATHIVDY
ncbi:prepilin-type N-terminal cleavage/methylation domain-containing protein, partial [Candidatus Gracilibacteria bacterium]|nr:prepilin-type N-terminal cleavage/methylation domain-containing protein [Candidatus Gracilibacteria bacterium]